MKDEAEEFRDLLADVASSGYVWVADTSGRFRYFSPRLQEFAGRARPPRDLAEWIAEHVHPADREELRRVAWRLRDQSGAEEICDVRIRDAGGTFRWMRARLRPFVHGTEQVVAGVALDIDDEKRLDAQLSLLVRAGEIFHRSLEVEVTLGNVARLAVESFADICFVDLLDDRSGLLYISVAAHRDPGKNEALAGAAALLYDEEYQQHPAVRVAESGGTFFAPELDRDPRAYAASERHLAFMQRLGYRSKIVVPVAAQGRVFGSLSFVRAGDRRFDLADRSLAEDLGRRAGLAVANAKRYQRERHVAETLQRAFVSDVLPSRPGIALYGLYLPGDEESEIGGDWYDAFVSADDGLVITIGDVAGKGVEAARLMVQTREAVRVAAQSATGPAAMLEIVNRALLTDRHERYVTAFVATLGPGSRTVRYASAGHPPPLLRPRRGPVRRLADPFPPLGFDRDLRIGEYGLELAPGDTLVLYTDGVTEVLRDAISGEVRLAEVLGSEALAYAADPARFLQRALSGAILRDDVAILALRFGDSSFRWQLDAETPRSAYAAKGQFLAALRGLSASHAVDPDAAELIFAELIGNAVRHAPGPLSLVLADDEDGPRLHVIDQGPGFDFRSSLPEDVWAESGRGLFLISALARSVQVSRLPGCGAYVAVGLPTVAVDERLATPA